MSHYYILTDDRGYAIVEHGKVIGCIYADVVRVGILFRYGAGFIEISCANKDLPPVIHSELTTTPKFDNVKTWNTHEWAIVDYIPILIKLYDYETIAYDIYDYFKSTPNVAFGISLARVQCAGKLFMFQLPEGRTELEIDEKNMTAQFCCGKLSLDSATEITVEYIQKMEEERDDIMPWLLLANYRPLNVTNSSLSSST
jgi:hypothetical protein